MARCTRSRSYCSYSGTLVAPNVSVLLSGKDHTVARQLEIGDSGSILTFFGPPDMPIVNFFERDHLLVELVDSALKVSTSIRDKDLSYPLIF